MSDSLPRHPLLIAKLGSTFRSLSSQIGDFEDWTRQGLAAMADGDATAVPPIHVLDPRQTDAPLPVPGALAGVVLTGSAATVMDREPWSERLKPWLQALVAHGTPVLGFCYGHQLLAAALGGDVAQRDSGAEIGTAMVHLNAAGQADALLGGLPSPFAAQTMHWQSVTRLPPQAVWLAQTDADPCHAFRVGECAWGVQFHPEFSAQTMRHYLNRLRDTLLREGQDVDALLAAVQPGPHAHAVLARFARLAGERVQGR